MDKNLFQYDLAVVAILKNEARYLKEWLDYHLLAGVDHFYLYDNDSSDNYNEIIVPYVEAGLVTTKYFPGKSMQFAAYDDAVLNYRFHCRYMAFIDLDEFIYPKSNQRISEVVDEILSGTAASGLAINWQLFGSNGELKADYSRGVLERFTRRAPIDWVVPIPHRDIPGGNAQIKTLANPRRIYFFTSAHFPIYFEGNYAINERGGVVPNYCNEPVTAEKIALNHYNVKSREEFLAKVNKGRADKSTNYFTVDWFDMYDRNEVFDDGILRYRAARGNVTLHPDCFVLESDAQRFNRMTDALIKTFEAQEFSLETALTCRAASRLLQEKFLEEASLGAVLKSFDDLKLADVQLLLSELPNLLPLPYPAVKDLRGAAIEIISQTMDFMRENEFWKEFLDLEHLRRLLQKI